MHYCNELYSLSVLSLYEGELIGTIDKLCFSKNLKKLVELEIINTEGVRMLLPTKNIYRVGKNAITVKNNQAVSIKVEPTELIYAPIGSKVYSVSGEFLGIVKEISLTEKFITEKLSLENNLNLDVDNLASCGKNSIIFNEQNKKVNVKKFVPTKTPKEFKLKEEQIVNAQPTVDPINHELKRVNSNCEFLIGRICVKDILNFNNEILIKANSKINKKNLSEIKRFGKLKELMLYSK